MRYRPVYLWLVLPSVLATASSCWGQPTVQAVLNGASYSGNVAPGTWVAIFGTQLAPSVAMAGSVPLPTHLNGVSVSIGGMAAPILYVSPNQINAIVPFESAPSTVVVTNASGSSVAREILYDKDSPGLFTQNASGSGRVLAFDADFRPVSMAGNAPIVLYADGLGPTSPPASSAYGGASAEPLNRVVDDLRVFVGDTSATVLFAGLAPGFPGIYQLNVIPNGPISDRVYIQVGGWQSNIASLPILPGSNVRNVIGTISSLYPPSSAPVNSSAMLIAGTFSASFDIVPGARPFSVVAASEAGNAVVKIDPINGTWQSTLSEPTLAARAGNFSPALGFNRIWFLSTCLKDGSCIPFPANVIPESSMDPAAILVMNLLPRVNSCAESLEAHQLLGLPYCSSINAAYSSSGVLPVDGHFSIGSPTNCTISPVDGSVTCASILSNFGRFIQIPAASPPSRTTTFGLYVDGKMITTRDVTYQIVQPH